MRIKNLFYLLLSILIVFGNYSCNKTESEDNITGTGNLEFSMNFVTLKKSNNEILENKNSLNIYSAVVSVKNDVGEYIYTNKEIKLYNFNGSFISEPLSLEIGNYSLEEFYIIDSSYNVNYAAPLESSPKAYLVKQPLPIAFKIEKDLVTKITPEVLSTEGCLPEDFGYITFGFNVIETFDFHVTVFEYDNSINNFKLTNANIEVSNLTDILFSGELSPITNKITINDGCTKYSVKILKNGYISYYNVFTIDSLKKHFNTPLTVILTPSNINDGLIAYYPFNSNANDESGNNFNGQVNEAVLTLDRKGNENSAYYFDGTNDFIEVPNFGNNIPTSDISVSMWIKTDLKKFQFQLMLCPDENRFGVSVNYSHNGQNSIFWDFGWLGDGGDVPGRLYTYPDFNSEWHHYVFISSVNHSKMEIYVDGNLLTSKSDPKTLLNSLDRSLKIGSGDNFGYHKGCLDEIRIYNRLISNDEILELFNE